MLIFEGVSNVDFEKVNVSWTMFLFIKGVLFFVTHFCCREVYLSKILQDTPKRACDNWLKTASLRGCLYGGELTRLVGLAHLGEISRSLRNSYKNVVYSHEK